MEGGDHKYVAWWNSSERFIKWPVKVSKPGKFRIQLTYSLGSTSSTQQVQIGGDEQNTIATLPPTISDSSEVEVSVGGNAVSSTLKAGKGWDDFKTEKFGEITLDKGNDLEVVLKSTKGPGAPVLHLRSITLVPVVAK